MKKIKSPFAISYEKVLKELQTSQKGLNKIEVKKRLVKYGPNVIKKTSEISLFKLFISQFKSILVVILIIAGIISFLLGETIDFVVIFIAIGSDIVVGFIQEYKASNAFKLLQKKLTLKTVTIRDNKKDEVAVTEIVPGDILYLKYGDKIPADARIIHSDNLKVDESILTGESLPEKKLNIELKEEIPLGDRRNMLYAGTNIIKGNCKAVVVATGLNTELGKISKHVASHKSQKSHIEKELNSFTVKLASVIFVIVLIIGVIGIIKNHGLVEIFTESVALMVAAVPESLPVVITVIFAIGMNKILKKKGLVKRLLATEVLGRCEVLCVDKTGTLTQGKMEVIDLITKENIDKINKKQLKDLEIVKAAVLCNQAFIDENTLKGDFTDQALYQLGDKYDITREKIYKKNTQIKFHAFDPEKKYAHISIRNKQNQDQINEYFLGAPEIIIDLIENQKGQQSQYKDQGFIQKIKNQNQNLGQKGYRIIAAALKTNKEFLLLGLIVISDPLRKSSKQTVQALRSAGLKLVIITGDQPHIAKNIAEKIGLNLAKQNIMTGKELDKLNDYELFQRIEDIVIFARMSPSQKVRVVLAWQKKKKIVAMTGDGVNDAPALNLADVGVALGSGTDIAKESADIVLMNNDLKTILNAIKEGRGILDNIKKVVTYLVSDTFAGLIVVAFSMIFNLPLALLPVQILWINFIEDGLPDIGLSLEKTEKDVMKYDPAIYKRSILDKEVKTIVFFMSLLNSFVLVGLYIVLHQVGSSETYIRTMIFTALSIDSMFFVYSCKNLKKPLWKIDILSNKVLNFSVIFGFAALAAALYIKPLQNLLQVEAIGVMEWIVLILLAFFNMIILESVKAFFMKIKYWD